MRLVGFKYLRRQPILTLAVILTMASTLFSITAFSLLGLYKSFNAYLGEREDIVSIYDTRSSTPFTGYVPAYLTERINLMNGVLASSPEVIAPCFLKDEPIFLRGIIPENFTELNQLTLHDGVMLEFSDLNSMIVGIKLAERLKLKTSDKVLVLGVFRDRYVELQVKGIFESHSSMDDEALAPLHVGQWLRADYRYVTLIRFKIDRNLISPDMIFEEVAKESSEPGQSQAGGQNPTGYSIIPIIRTQFGIEDVGVAGAQKFMKSYMDRYGVTREALLILSIAIFSLASASVISASRVFIYQHKGEIEILRSLGASNRTIRTDLLAKVLPWSLLFSIAGTCIGILALVVIERSNQLQVLSHSIIFQFDPLILALQLIFSSLIVAFCMLRSLKSKI